MIGRTFSHYQIVEKLGEGGMGVVYRALDTRLNRSVALKFLPAGVVSDEDRRWRFEREARTASALNHPHIVTIYDIGQADGSDFIAMEFVQGRPLDRAIPAGGLPVETALDWAVQTAEALAAAHGAGIVHRDIKPSNVFVSDSGQIKVLDFGLAKLQPEDAGPAADSRLATATGVERTGIPDRSPETRRGTVLGTPAYMSPEQAQGKPVDARSDVFSFGALLYEMLAGARPFQGDSALATFAAILRDPTPPLRAVRRDVPKELERIVRRCLEKPPEARYASAAELARDLRSLRNRHAPGATSGGASARRTLFAAAALVLALVAGVAYLVWRNGRVRWAREVALPEVARLTDKGQLVPAILLAAQAQRWVPTDVARLKREQWFARAVRTEPEGAEVFFKGYREPAAAWLHLGKSPVTPRLPFGNYRWRLVREGSEPVEGVGAAEVVSFRMPPRGSLPAGMVLVPGGMEAVGIAPSAEVGDFWLGRFEVTNREFQQFVSRGGYRERRWWKQPFVESGRTLGFDEAMARFRDSTGRPGPAMWELGAFAEGRADYPVSGVSWYEAAAYAEFAGASLPTIYHWRRAAHIGIHSDVLAFSNFGGSGTWPVGSKPGIGTYGTYDLAGNVKEWCWNATGDRRYTLGGGFDDPEYMFADEDAASPFSRPRGQGFRSAKFSAPLQAALTAPIERLFRDYSKEKPVSDEVFRVLRDLYAYDRRPIDARVEGVDERSPYWRKEKVSFDAGHGTERVTAYLFLPRNRPGPHQTVIYFPAGNARILRSSENVPMRGIDFVVRSGRALLYPVYEGTFERRTPGPLTQTVRRDQVLHWRRELGRSVDYIETRADLDAKHIAFYGFSMGSTAGSVLLAMEDRIRAAVLAAGGLDVEAVPPEIDPINFLPRIRIPVLMINGRYDFENPVETSQLPMFRILGTPGENKKHVLFDSGHSLPINEVVREVLDWFDRWLGPVGGGTG